MTNFIEEFYYGNLDPQARSTRENKTVEMQAIGAGSVKNKWKF